MSMFDRTFKKAAEKMKDAAKTTIEPIHQEVTQKVDQKADTYFKLLKVGLLGILFTAVMKQIGGGTQAGLGPGTVIINNYLDRKEN